MNGNINLKSSIFLLIIILLVPNFINAAEIDVNFSDVEKTNWFYNSVMDLTQKEIISGYGDNTFKPNKNITFGEFLKLAITSTTKKTFPAQKGEHWAMGFYREAIFTGVIDSTNYRPDKKTFESPLTREDMAYIVIGVNENIQKESALNTSDIKVEIRDFGKISKKNEISVLQAYEKGLINGKNGFFHPFSNTTRAEASTVIVRLLNKNKRIK